MANELVDCIVKAAAVYNHSINAYSVGTQHERMHPKAGGALLRLKKPQTYRLLWEPVDTAEHLDILARLYAPPPPVPPPVTITIEDTTRIQQLEHAVTVLDHEVDELERSVQREQQLKAAADRALGEAQEEVLRMRSAALLAEAEAKQAKEDAAAAVDDAAAARAASEAIARELGDVRRALRDAEDEYRICDMRTHELEDAVDEYRRIAAVVALLRASGHEDPVAYVTRLEQELSVVKLAASQVRRCYPHLHVTCTGMAG